MTKNTPTRIVILTLLLAAGIFSAMLWSRSVWFPVCGVAVFALFNVFPSFVKRPDKKLRISSDGADLLTAFLALVCIPILRKLCNKLVFFLILDMFCNHIHSRFDSFLERNNPSIRNVFNNRCKMAYYRNNLRNDTDSAYICAYKNNRVGSF